MLFVTGAGSPRISPSSIMISRLTTLLLAACLTYLLLAVRRAYKQGWVLTVSKCVILLAGIMFIVQLTNSVCSLLLFIRFEQVGHRSFAASQEGAGVKSSADFAESTDKAEP